MAFDFKAFRDLCLQNYKSNNTAILDYALSGISYLPLSSSNPAWRVIGIKHLTGSENSYNHHLLVDTIDKAGNRIYNTKLSLTRSEVSGTDVLIVDKPENEVGTNTPIWWNDTVSIWVNASIGSDLAKGFNVRYEDENGNNRAHHSFYVVFLLADDTQAPPEEPVETDDTFEVLTIIMKNGVEIKRHSETVS